MPNQIKNKTLKSFLGGFATVFLLLLCVIVVGGTKAAAKSVEDYDLVKQSGTKVDLSIRGMRYYNRAYTMLEALNAKRKELNLPTFTMDKTLMERAMDRAAELLIYNCNVRTDGTMFIFTDEGGEMTSLTNLTNTNYIVNQWSSEQDIEGYTNMRERSFTSVGVGCVYGGGYYAYAVFLKEGTADEPASIPNNASTIFSMKVDKAYLANITSNVQEGYALSRGTTSNIYMSVVNLGNPNLTMALDPSCVNYSTTNSNVLPVSSTGLIQANSVGKAIITMKLKSDTTMNCSREITVVPSNISCATIDPIPNQTYTGKEIKPTITVRNGSTVLREGTDYRLQYENNIEVGTATVYVTGVGEYNNTIIANFDIVKASNPILMANLSVSSTGLTGDAVTLRAGASNGTSPYTYTFSVKTPKTNAFATIKTGTSSFCTYTPTTAGTYQFKIKVTDSKGATAEYTDSLSIKQKVMTAKISLSATSIKPSTAVTIKPTVSNSTGTVYYTYEYKKSSATSWTTLKSKSTAGSYTWTPKTSGSYTIRVTITDSNITIYPTAALTVQNSDLAFKTASVSASKVLPNTAITLKAEMQKGIGSYSYAFFYKKSTASSYTVLQSYSSTNTATFKTATAGTYTLLIRGKDSSGTVVQKSFTVVVGSTLQNKSVVSATSVVRNASITITGKASNGISPYQYAYLVRSSSAASYTVLKNYSTATSYKWKSDKVGTYTLMVKVKDADGKVVSKTFTVTVKNAALANVSTVSTTVLNRGEHTVLTGNATGGVGQYQYAIAAKHESSKNYTTLKAYNTTAKYTWTPAKSGTYTVVIKVKDENGTPVQKFFAVKVMAVGLENNSTVTSKNITYGNGITLKGVAAGGTAPYQYAMIAKHSSASSYTVLQDYSTTASKYWKPSQTGTYSVIIKVKDAHGTIESKSFTVTVKAVELVNFSTVTSKKVAYGKGITLKGVADGGTAPYQYAMIAKHSSASSYTVLQDYSTTASKYWKPSKTGTYSVIIKVKDAHGTVVPKYFTITVT